MARHRQTASLVLTGAISILVGFVPGYLTGLRHGLDTNKEHAAHFSSSQPLAAGLSNPVLDLQATEIIKELNCVCGCKMELAPCTCDEQRGAQEIRQAVRTLVEQGIPRPEIIKALMERYGEAVMVKKT